MQPILKIDLSTGHTGEYIIPREWVHDYIGGPSLAARILYDHLHASLNPLTPEAPLLCLVGPLTGTAGPATGRFTVCGKSPATGLWAESNIGGFWGPELRQAGWDGVWITGKAEKPVYLFIENDKVDVRDALHLWGQDTYEVQDSVKAELGIPGTRVLGIGPAGEAQIPFSLLLCDHGRVAGRTGLGAVMGAKNLKAIAVRGLGKIPIADPDVFLPLRSETNRALKSDALSRVFSDLGTAGGADYFDYLGVMPKKYYSTGTLENSDLLSGSNIRETILAGKSACHGCVIACGRVVRLEDGVKRKGPEYETLVGFGANLGITDPRAITMMGELCDRYGLDTISTSNVIGLAFRLFEMGLITTRETNNLSLKWGNNLSAIQLIKLIVRREGFGSILSQGSLALARCYGVEDEAIQVNNLEVAYHDPRGSSGMAIVYATSPRGACHNQSDYFLVDIGQTEESIGIELFDRHVGAEKAANVARHQNWRTLNNALIVCMFANVPPAAVTELVNSACGSNYSLDDLMISGDRAWNLKRMINHRLGLTRANDVLPKPFLRPLPDGGAAGFVPDFDPMMAAYYEARAWDSETGIPTESKLKSLGLDWTLPVIRE
jgi:aldehyde:ferredoxin oxidoreductase